MDALKKVFQIEVKKEDVDDDENTLLATVSSEKRDRDGEIIRLTGNSMDLTGYRKNPVLLWQHRPDNPIGKSLWIKTDKKRLLAKFRFHRKTQISKEIFELYKTGFLNSFSVGFKPLEKKDENGVYRKSELLEISCVSIPSNTDAITQNDYGEKITDGILRKDLNLESLGPEYHPVDFGAGLSNKKLQEIANTGLLMALDNLREQVSGESKERIIEVVKEDKEIEIEIPLLKRMFSKKMKENPDQAGKLIADAMRINKKMGEELLDEMTEFNKIVQMGKLAGKVF